MTFRRYTVYKRIMMIEIGDQTREKNSKYYGKCSNNFSADCTPSSLNSIPIKGKMLKILLKKIFFKVDEYFVFNKTMGNV